MYALTIQDLVKTYPSGVKAVSGIDLTVEEGEFFALLGPNGAGKSTTIGIITSLINKTSGTVSIFGNDINLDPIAAKSCLGLVPQELNINHFETILDIVVNQAGYYGIPRKIALQRAELYLRKLDLWDKRHSISKSLSGGMKRRLMIARGLVHNPRMLILDEPTTGVDIELRRSTWKFLQEINNNGTTIILTTHYLEEAEHLCNGVAIIDQGKILKKTTIKKLLTSLQFETILLDLVEPLAADENISSAEFNLIKIDDLTLEASFTKKQNLNQLFVELSQKGINVTSMRNKSNRLEELFLDLVNTNGNSNGN